jgi:cardiolipin synthase
MIDGAVGYTGSMCVRDGMKSWRDTNVRLEGQVAGSMQNAFDRMWARAFKKRPLPKRLLSRNAEFSYVTNYPTPGKRHVYRALAEAIRHAKKYIYITTPYFVPTHRLVRLLRAAARDGVDVRIILPERTDHYPTLDIAARSYFSTLLESHVRIFLYQGNVIHSKAMTIDGEWATVGSMNLDSASLLYNFEANIVTTNATFAGELAAHFKRDMEESKEVTLKEWRGRFFLEKIPEILIRLVSKFL